MEPEQKSVGQQVLESAGDAALSGVAEGCLGCLFNGLGALAIVIAAGCWIFGSALERLLPKASGTEAGNSEPLR